MRRITMMLSLAVAAGSAAPAIAGAQWEILRRAEERVGTRDGDVYDRDRDTRDRRSSRIPPGHMPPPGSCRVWVDGTPPGRQPRPTDCRTAERERSRYGSNARVIYGDRTYGRSDDRYDRRDQRTQRVYNRTINGRQCRVIETWQYGRRTDTRTVCDSSNDRRVYDDRVYQRNDDRYYDRDDDRRKVKKVKVKHKNGKKGRD